MPLDFAAQQEATALQDDLDLLEVVQAPGDFGPLGSETFLPQAQFEFPLQAESQKRTEHVPSDRLIAFVVNRARLQDTLGCAERVLDHPERFVNVGHGFRIVVGVGAQHEEPVITLVEGDQLFIDGEVAALLGFQEPTVAFVSHQALVAPVAALRPGTPGWPRGHGHPCASLPH